MENPRAQMSEWIAKAFRTVNAAFPQVRWDSDTEETRAAQENLSDQLYGYLYQNGVIDDVRDAWRRYYKAHLPETQKEMFG